MPSSLDTIINPIGIGQLHFYSVLEEQVEMGLYGVSKSRRYS